MIVVISLNMVIGLVTPRHPDDIKMEYCETFEAYCVAIRRACEIWGERIPLYRDPLKVLSCLVCGLPEIGPLAEIRSELKEDLRDAEYRLTHKYQPWLQKLNWDNVVRMCREALEAHRRQVAREGVADSIIGYMARDGGRKNANGESDPSSGGVSTCYSGVAGGGSGPS